MDLSELIRPEIRKLVPYSPGKSSDEVKRELGLEEVIKLASNENPLGPSPRAIAAMCEAAPDVLYYPDPTWRELTEALGKKFGLDTETVIIGRGSDEIMHMAGLALLEPGSEVVFSDPPFSMYPMTATLFNATSVPVPAKNLTHDLEAMAASCTDRTRLVFVSNPYNPCGTIVSQAEVDRFLDAVPDRCVVVLDEAYYEYVDDPSYPNSLEYVRQGRPVIVLRTFSKIYALAGLRIGYGFMPPALATGLRQTCEPFNVSSVALAAALASLEDEEQVTRSQQMVWEGREYFYREFDRLGLHYAPTQANFIYVDVKMPSVECFHHLMRRGVTIRTGDIFGMPTWIRVSIGTMHHNRAAIKHLEAVLGEAK